MNIKSMIKEEIMSVLEVSMTKKFTKAVEALQKVQLEQQKVRKAFVKESDPKKKGKYKDALIKMHKIVQKAEAQFNDAVKGEPIDMDEAKSGNNTQYAWSQINNALMKYGMSPKNIGKFLSVLNKTDEIAESVITESPIDEFTKELNGENIKAKIYTATGDGKAVEAQFTNKKWDDGVPVTKYLTRGGNKSVKTPKGKFKVIETEKFWYYEIKNGWAAVSTKKYGTPPFEY